MAIVVTSIAIGNRSGHLRHPGPSTTCKSLRRSNETCPQQLRPTKVRSTLKLPRRSASCKVMPPYLKQVGLESNIWEVKRHLRPSVSPPSSVLSQEQKDKDEDLIKDLEWHRKSRRWGSNPRPWFCGEVRRSKPQDRQLTSVSHSLPQVGALAWRTKGLRLRKVAASGATATRVPKFAEEAPLQHRVFQHHPPTRFKKTK